MGDTTRGCVNVLFQLEEHSFSNHIRRRMITLWRECLFVADPNSPLSLIEVGRRSGRGGRFHSDSQARVQQRPGADPRRREGVAVGRWPVRLRFAVRNAQAAVPVRQAQSRKTQSQDGARADTLRIWLRLSGSCFVEGTRFSGTDRTAPEQSFAVIEHRRLARSHAIFGPGEGEPLTVPMRRDGRGH